MSEQPPRRRRQRRPSTDQDGFRQGSGQPPSRPSKDDGLRTKESDSLGRLLEHHEVTLGGLIVVCGITAAIGSAGLIWGLVQERTGRVWLTAVIIGAFVILLAGILFCINIMNLGRRLELRKKGLRWQERGNTVEFFWKEIAHIEVDRLDATNIGVGTKYTRGRDAAAVSGPLTKTEFTVTVTTSDGRSLTLSPIFLRTVSDPKKLITNLKLRAGI